MPLQVEAHEIIRRALDSRVQDLWTTFPAKVLEYDAATQTVEVQPQIRRPLPTEDGAIDFEDLPILPNLPVLFPRGNGYAITWPISPGDFVWIHVCTNATGNWRRTGEVADPGDVRTHSLGSAFAVPGAAPNSATLPQAATVALVLEGPEIRIGKDATDAPAKATPTQANFVRILDAIKNATPTPGDGGAALKAAIVLALEVTNPFANVAASKAKVE